MGSQIYFKDKDFLPFKPVTNISLEECIRQKTDYALIVIDIQQRFLKSSIKETSRNAVEKNLILPNIKILKFCQEYNIPTIALQMDRFGLTLGRVSSQIEKIPQHLYLVKKEMDGFSERALEEVLNKWGASKLCLTGLYAEFCVYETARTAKRKGYKVLTASDLIFARGSSIIKEKYQYDIGADYFDDYKEMIEQIRGEL